MSTKAITTHQVCGGVYCRRRLVENAPGTIFYIHGLGESGLCFESLIEDPRLAAWSHVAIDMPGYGKSPWPSPPLGLAAQTEFLLSWIEERQLTRLVILGHSMGGALGTALCERAPQRMLGFVNVEGNISLDDCTYSADIADLSLDAWLAEGRDAILNEIYREGIDEDSLCTYFASCAMCDPRVLHLDAVELVEASRRGDLAPRFAALEMPKIYLIGYPCGIDEPSRRLLEAAGASWHAIEDAGHWPFLDQPDAFIEELVSFLEPLAAAGRNN